MNPSSPDSTFNVSVNRAPSGRETITESTVRDRTNQTIDGAARNRLNQDQTDTPQTARQYRESTPLPMERTARTIAAYGVKKIRKKKSVTARATTRAKASAANGWVLGWIMFWYTTVQLPFALVSIAGLGMGYAVYETLRMTIGEGAADTIISIAVSGADGIRNAIYGIANLLFGFSYDPLFLFFIPFIAVFVLGVLQLMICWFIYSALGIKSLSGSAGAAKQIAFMVAGIGIVIPFLNILPLILIWAAIVWWRPY